jgi:hypothetical protein
VIHEGYAINKGLALSGNGIIEVVNFENGRFEGESRCRIEKSISAAVACGNLLFVAVNANSEDWSIQAINLSEILLGNIIHCMESPIISSAEINSVAFSKFTANEYC